MAKVVVEDLELNYINIKTIFLNPLLQEQIYIQISNLLRDLKPNLKGVKDAYLKLNKLLYSLKQVLREWFYIVKKFFKNIGLKSAKANPNLFIGNKVYILLFINDILIIGKRQHLNIIKTRILREWRCKDLGPAKVFIGF